MPRYSPVDALPLTSGMGRCQRFRIVDIIAGLCTIAGYFSLSVAKFAGFTVFFRMYVGYVGDRSRLLGYWAGVAGVLQTTFLTMPLSSDGWPVAFPGE